MELAFDILGADHPLPFDAQGARISVLLRVQLEAQLLQVQQDRHDVFFHALDHGIFVHDLIDLDGRDRAAFKAGQKNAAQANLPIVWP